MDANKCNIQYTAGGKTIQFLQIKVTSAGYEEHTTYNTRLIVRLFTVSVLHL